MQLMSCTTTLAAVACSLLAIYVVVSTDFAGMFSKVLDFEFKSLSIDLAKLIPVPVACALIFTLVSGEVKVGNTVAKVVACDKKEAVVFNCSLCSLSDKIALK